MNVTEIRKLIRQSDDKAWYRSVTLHLNYPDSQFEIELQGLDSIYNFFKKQFEFFDNIKELPQTLVRSKNHFKTCFENIENQVSSNLERKRNDHKRSWSNALSLLEGSGSGQKLIFTKESATTDFLLKLDSEYKGASTGAFDFFTNQTFDYSSSDKNYFIGWQRAYEFFTQDSELVKRRNNERQTLSKIRSEYNKNLEKNDTNVAEHIAEKEKLYLDKEKAISRLIKKKNYQFVTWKKESQDEFSKFLKDSDTSFKELESIYKEKLKLEAPAKYWNDRAVKLKKEGEKWLIGLIVCSVIAIISLGAVLYFISDGTIKDLFSTSASAIRWSIVFITFVSFLAFAIRIFSKLTFSSYHLVRDAEEREQLAYVFLALKKEKNIDPTEQHLIMQSLFSRADSGLLKDDASPTMPGGSVIEKLMGGNK